MRYNDDHMPDIIDSIFPKQHTGQIISIGLLLPHDQSETAIEMSHQINRLSPVESLLDQKSQPPFVRLYETVFPVANGSKVAEAAAKIADAAVPVYMKWNGMEIATHNLIIWGVLNDALDRLHRTVLESLNPLRDGYYKQKYRSDESMLTGDERSSLHQWGSPWAENYLPHMVLAKSVRQFEVGPLEEFEWEYGGCDLSGILVGMKSPHGSFSEIHTFPFTGSRKTA